MAVKKKWREAFERSHRRITFSRKAIMKVLQEKGQHLSAEEVYKCLREKNCKVGIATVYRNLKLVSQMGLVNQVNFGDGKEYYEIAKVPALHHHHLVCTVCGKVIDYSDFREEENEFVDILGKKLEKIYDFTIQSHQLYFYGVCKDCR